MQKVEGVKSVVVSLKDGLTVLELREGNVVTLAQLRTVIKNNGFVSRDANIVARGSLTGNTFEVRFSREILRVNGQLAKMENDRWRLVVPQK
jgi:hypothetical protein